MHFLDSTYARISSRHFVSFNLLLLMPTVLGHTWHSHTSTRIIAVAEKLYFAPHYVLIRGKNSQQKPGNAKCLCVLHIEISLSVFWSCRLSTESAVLRCRARVTYKWNVEMPLCRLSITWTSGSVFPIIRSGRLQPCFRCPLSCHKPSMALLGNPT